MFLGLSSDSPAGLFMANVFTSLFAKRGLPTAILMVSAHWEAGGNEGVLLHGPRSSALPLYYDYGFDGAEFYNYTWTHPGPSPSLVGRVQKALADAGIASSTDGTRGADHGTFVPLLPALAAHPNIPVFQVSIASHLDPAFHLRLGQALGALRNDVLIIGSGEATHNLGAFRPNAGKPAAVPSWATAFTNTLKSLAAAPPEERFAGLMNLHTDANFRKAHPREDHLIPFHVAAGASAPWVAVPKTRWSSANPGGPPPAASVGVAAGGEVHEAGVVPGSGKMVHESYAGALSLANFRFE